jgi:16S rRNA (guanine527-N7)-methyltransferase
MSDPSHFALLTPDQFVEFMAADGVAVSRETLAKLQLYADMLADWQTRMNLVGPATLADVWRRHMLDSAQLIPFIPAFEESTWLDIGTGAGFPGLVLAILGAGHVHLVDSTSKKCRFLEAVAEATGVQDRVSVHNVRIEDLSPFSPMFITSRACAPLARLIPWAYRFQGKDTGWLLLKGQGVETELTEAEKSWTFKAKLQESRTDPRGRLVALTAVAWRKTKKR